ncbi:unnamed protein product [Tilletia controversa]|uniref:Epoxide hydrolase N-terminal domain-containing protein n=1 Tax=Tilletia controversa TaxID=13291 RepID=A0A8X7N0K9_9BASI|nr:hypothetical protein CF328_g3039 [Tilletia controversa]KAE8255735.1 hypothetical protein A4X06_0g275 [Tilletia controversa]CAD6976472.1 unnamed protein product [Tilletia controversa]
MSDTVDVLLLGATGWSANWIIPALRERKLSYALTSRSGSPANPTQEPTIPFTLSNDWTDEQVAEATQVLPPAKAIIIVFPIKSTDVMQAFVKAYHDRFQHQTRWIQLGSSGIWLSGQNNSESPIDPTNPRGQAEQVLLGLTDPAQNRLTTVLNLAGLYGGTRHPVNFARKVAPSKAALARKGTLHLIHGIDVAYSILLTITSESSSRLWGHRWILTDTNVYDWWQLMLSFELPDAKIWVKELMTENGVKSLPRPVASSPDQGPPQYLDRALDGSEFWKHVNAHPKVGRVDEASDLVEDNGATVAASSDPRAIFDVGDVREFTPELPSGKVEDLRRRIVESIKDTPTPPSPFEADKDRFGLSHAKFDHLRKAWATFLENPDPSVGAEHDSWAARWAHVQTFSHFKVEVEQTELHFIREQPDLEEARRSGRPVIPLLLIHGWPGSFLEFLHVARPLAHPGPSAPSWIPAFDVVIPSSPGYTFSSLPKIRRRAKTSNIACGNNSGPDGDLLVSDVARLFDKLMVKLGYGKDGYAVQAGDWGSMVCRSMAVQFPERVKAVHLNFIPAPPACLSIPILSAVAPPGSTARSILKAIPGSGLVGSVLSTLAALPVSVPRRWWLSDFLVAGRSTNFLGLFARLNWSLFGRVLGQGHLLTDREADNIERGIIFQESGSSYASMHRTRPTTLGLAMASSPLAQLAWIGEKFYAWTDEDPSESEILTSLTLWWCTDTMPRSLYPYRNRPPLGVQSVIARPENFIKCPTGHSDFPKEIIPSPKKWIEGTCNLTWYRVHNSGGHFAAMEKPDLFVEDMRDCFGSIYPVQSTK